MYINSRESIDRYTRMHYVKKKYVIISNKIVYNGSKCPV